MTSSTSSTPSTSSALNLVTAFLSRHHIKYDICNDIMLNISCVSRTACEMFIENDSYRVETHPDVADEYFCKVYYVFNSVYDDKHYQAYKSPTELFKYILSKHNKHNKQHLDIVRPTLK